MSSDKRQYFHCPPDSCESLLTVGHMTEVPIATRGLWFFTCAILVVDSLTRN